MQVLTSSLGRLLFVTASTVVFFVPTLARADYCDDMADYAAVDAFAACMESSGDSNLCEEAAGAAFDDAYSSCDGLGNWQLMIPMLPVSN